MRASCDCQRQPPCRAAALLLLVLGAARLTPWSARAFPVRFLVIGDWGRATTRCSTGAARFCANAGALRDGHGMAVTATACMQPHCSCHCARQHADPLPQQPHWL